MKTIFIPTILFILFFSGKIAAQNASNIFKYFVGDIEVTLLSEGVNKNSTSILLNATTDMIKQYAPDGEFPAGCNAFLVKTPNKIILVDAGFGIKLFENLALLNIKPDQIDVVLLTHMHNDHIGGLLQDEKVVFENAEIYIAQAEHDYWIENSSGAAIAKKVIAAYKNKLHLFTPADLTDEKSELLNGIRAIAAYGHTLGHTAYLLTSGKSNLLIWGDLTHAMAFQMPHPEITVTYDINPDQAAITRKNILKYVASKKIPIAGMHVHFPAIGFIKANKNESYIFEPVEK
jgi:glyoxylase-like metal-dependent hydrolase (beta-lactamase superfamily II)